jgi:hypothetical protein
MKTVVLLLALGLVAQAAMNRSPKHLTSDFILAQVKSRLTAQGPLNEVYELLDTLEKQIRDEQIAHDDSRIIQNKNCVDEEAFRTKEINDAKFAMERALAEEKRCQGALDKSNDLLTKNRKDQEINRAALEAQINQRDADKKLYDQRKQDHADLISAIDRSVDIVNSLLEPQSTGALIQLNRQLTNLLVVSSRNRQTKSAAPIITAMAQIALNKFSNQASVEKVLGLLETLRKNTEKSEDNYDEDERKSIELYNEVVAELGNEYDRLLSEEAVLVKHVADMTACVANEKAVFEEAQRKFIRNTELLESSRALCESWESQYQVETDNRNEELDVISDLREITKRRLSQLKGDAAKRADQDAFDAYKNKYEYDAYQKFKSDDTVYDEKGAKGAGFVRDQSLEK